MRMWDTNICLTSKRSMRVILITISSLLILAFSYSNTPQKELLIKYEEEPWKPSEDDIAYQDSMFTIVEQTSMDMDTIKAAIDNILYKLERLEYADGSYDSIRYVAGSQFDINRSNRN